MEHRGTSFANSCVKVPVNPYSRQPTPSYERSEAKSQRFGSCERSRRINFACENRDANPEEEVASPRETLENFLDFLESIPDYGDVHHLSNEQFKQKLDFLKRRQRVLLKNLRNCLEREDEEDVLEVVGGSSRPESEKLKDQAPELTLKGKKCNFEESRTDSPVLFSSGNFAGLAKDQDLLTYRCKDKDKSAKTRRNREIYSANKSWSTWSESKCSESADSDDDSIETKSLPPCSPKRWHPTVPKPFSFTLREEAEKYMSLAEKETEEKSVKETNKKKTSTKKRRFVRPIPLTSKLPLYDKLLAAKEERSRLVREESAWSLMSQVRPFKLECDRRAWRAMIRSSPELCSSGIKNPRGTSRFKAKPIPRNLFGTEIYDRMLEDEYYRALRKRIRAAELMKSSSLPPSMARRERIKSASTRLDEKNFDVFGERALGGRESTGASVTPLPSERSRSALNLLSARGNNLAAILRCQASRDKLAREIQERMEEKSREQAAKFREALIGRKPAWRALRSAARHEHERDLDIRASLRRDEAREQAERHRLQMELMLDRVVQIPTLFERHSQSYQSLPYALKSDSGKSKKKKKKKKTKKLKRENSGSTDSYGSLGNSPRPNSGSLTSSSGTLASLSRSTKSSGSRKSEKSTVQSANSASKKKSDRGPLKVSINETAELIEDYNREGRCSGDSTPSNERNGNGLENFQDDMEKINALIDNEKYSKS